MADIHSIIAQHGLLLYEAAIVERLRRCDAGLLDAALVNAPLIYNQAASAQMALFYNDYIQVATNANLPLLLCTPTWRANQDRVRQSRQPSCINEDAVAWMQRLPISENTFVGGMTGPKNDCYLPEEAPSAKEAEAFHAWQINKLGNTSVDFLQAETLPAVSEALGIARAMAATDKPYILSFVINRKGQILDGTSLSDAIQRIDAETARPPLGYSVNCAHPSFLCVEQQPKSLFKRLIGYQANASALDHCDLEGAEELQADDINDWAEQMRQLHQHGIKILGGCCGTTGEHLKRVIR